MITIIIVIANEIIKIIVIPASIQPIDFSMLLVSLKHEVILHIATLDNINVINKVKVVNTIPNIIHFFLFWHLIVPPKINLINCD